MKRKNKKLLTLILAGSLCAAAVGAVATMGSVSAAAADAKTVELTQVFEGSASTVVSAKKVADTDTAETAMFTLKNSESVSFKRNLAFKWFEDKDAVKYLNLDFTFADVKFDTLSFRFESTPAEATEDEKGINVLKFGKNADGKVTACVLNGTEKEPDDGVKVLDVVANTQVKITLAEHSEYGKFIVKVNEVEVGVFENVGANFSKYSYDAWDSLYIQATTKNGEATTLYLNEINGQKFNNITTDTETNKKVVTDTAKPVLVVNEDVSGFLLGTQFSLNFEKIDVLNKDAITENKFYYQYNPLDKEPVYKALSTSTYFMDTVYEKDGETTSVYREEGKEYVSVKIALGDPGAADSEKKEYMLSWYADAAAVVQKEQGTDAKKTTDFIIADRNEEGATYFNQNEDKTWAATDITAAVETYQKLLAKNAEKVKAGSNANMQFPSLEWLINDNNGYRALKFTICYKKPSSTSPSTSSNLSYNGLKLSAGEVGLYEFKVFATDKAGNPMKCYDENGKLVSVSASNIWDIDEIPSFSYTIKNQGVSVNETSMKDKDRVSTQLLSETYTFSDVTIIGASTQKSDYALYKLDYSNYKQIPQATLSSVKYETIRKNVAGKILTYEGDYFDLYVGEYANQIAKALGVTDANEIAKIKGCFKKIEAFDDRIDKEKDSDAWEKSDNKYNWQPASKSFTAAEAGTYLIMADYWDEDLARVDRTPAYKLIFVEAETDVIKGETQWLQNNLISVILFSVAALMLIAIIVLLLVKPSDETLADVDAKAAAKKKALEKKNASKKNK